jgi:zinc transport system substrate-binding protein
MKFVMKICCRMLLVEALFFGFTNQSLMAAEKLQVVATIFPVYDFARQIGGDLVETTLLLPPGVEAHSFSPTPKDIARISKADILVYTGKYMEPWVEDLLKGIENKDLCVIDASKGIELMGEEHHDHEGAEHEKEGEHHTDEAEHHHHGGVDPHIWLDPLLVQKMVQTIAAGFAAQDVGNATIYQKNAQAYSRQLGDLDAQIRQMLTSCKHKEIIYGGHFAFGYFARRYGLEHTSPYDGFAPNAEPSPKNIAELIDKIKTTGVKVIYYEELLEPKVAKAISQETGATMLLLHGAHNVSKAEREQGVTYLAIMQANLANLKIGLECQ